MVRYKKNPLIDDKVPSKLATFLDEELGSYIFVKDGNIIKSNVSKAFDGIYIENFDEAIADKQSLFEKIDQINQVESDAYNYVMENANSGIVIHVPKNRQITERLNVFIIQDEHDLVHSTTVYLEENSSFKYFEYLYNDKEASINIVSNSYVSENARLNYSGISRFGNKAVVNVMRNGYIQRYGNAEYSIAEVNDSLTESNTNLFLEQDYAVATTKTVAITHHEQEAKFRQLVKHNAPYTEGYIENYGVSNNQSVLVFEGIGKISKDMKHSIARQSNRGIVLGETSRLDANPLLLIDEYDVVASHGAAIGKIDEEQLYYLMSRGLTLKTAERLIIHGFLSPVINNLSSQKLIEDFVHSVESKTI
jgi:Fe-S cluster assembly protein SufD